MKTNVVFYTLLYIVQLLTEKPIEMANKTYIISVANRKGGVGKSTITILLATSIANQFGKKILVLDLDSQETSKYVYDIDVAVDRKPLFDIISTHSRALVDVLRENDGKYDIILLDLPRITEKITDAENSVLNGVIFSDAVLIPTVGTVLDVASTHGFYQMVKEFHEYKKKNKQPYKYRVLVNRSNYRATNDHAVEYMKKEKMKLMENRLGDYAIFQNVSTDVDILESAEGQKRWKPFFDEFCETFKIQ